VDGKTGIDTGATSCQEPEERWDGRGWLVSTYDCQYEL